MLKIPDEEDSTMKTVEVYRKEDVVRVSHPPASKDNILTCSRSWSLRNQLIRRVLLVAVKCESASRFCQTGRGKQVNVKLDGLFDLQPSLNTSTLSLPLSSWAWWTRSLALGGRMEGTSRRSILQSWLSGDWKSSLGVTIASRNQRRNFQKLRVLFLSLIQSPDVRHNLKWRMAIDHMSLYPTTISCLVTPIHKIANANLRLRSKQFAHLDP